MKLIFLDIDGVLNGHEFNEQAKSCAIVPSCMARLNRIIRLTGCKVVISSAWRYMIHGGAMTLTGFGYMLRTHGFAHAESLVGCTAADEVVPTRAEQVQAFIAGQVGVEKAIALDDCPFNFGDYGITSHITDGGVGLTDEDVDAVVALLSAAGGEG